MWILPKNLSPIFPSVSVTEESTSACIEYLEKTSGWLLFVKSKPLPLKTLLRRWKQGYYPRLQYGLISGAFLGRHSQVARWYRQVFHVSHSAMQDVEKRITTLATCSHRSSKASQDADLPLFSWKTSRESSAQNSEETIGTTQPEHPFCSMSSGNWKDWITSQRQEYLMRRARSTSTETPRHISVRELSYWPTARSRDWKDSANASQNHSRVESGKCTLGEFVHSMHGPADQTKANTGGNPQESATNDLLFPEMKNWPTPAVVDGGKIGNKPNFGQICLSNHPAIVGLPTREKGIKSGKEPIWPTITVSDSLGSRREGYMDDGKERAASNPRKETLTGHSGTTLNDAMDKWATPQSRDYKGGEAPEKWKARAEKKKAEGIDLHLPLDTQALQSPGENWSTPTALWGSMYFESNADQRHTPSLATQATWATPQCQDAHNVNQSCTEHKTLPSQLTKMGKTMKLNVRWVETLLGIPMGWLCPECPPSVIKNWQKYILGCTAAYLASMNSGWPETESAPQLLKQPSEHSSTDC